MTKACRIQLLDMEALSAVKRQSFLSIHKMRFHPSHRPFHPLYGFRFQNQAGTALEGKMQILLQGDFSGAKGKVIFSRRGVVEMKWCSLSLRLIIIGSSL